jgi:hypothetical protein
MRPTQTSQRSPFLRFLRRLFYISLFIGLVAFSFFAIQTLFHPFTGVITQFEALMDRIDSKVSSEVSNNISIGGLCLILAICFLPIFFSKIDDIAYVRGLGRGVIGAAVFLLSDFFYTRAASKSTAHLLAAILGTVLITGIVIEALSFAIKGSEDEQRSFRTDIISCIASGIFFSTLLKLGKIGFYALKAFIAHRIG